MDKAAAIAEYTATMQIELALIGKFTADGHWTRDRALSLRMVQVETDELNAMPAATTQEGDRPAAKALQATF